MVHCILSDPRFFFPLDEDGTPTRRSLGRRGKRGEPRRAPRTDPPAPSEDEGILAYTALPVEKVR